MESFRALPLLQGGLICLQNRCRAGRAVWHGESAQIFARTPITPNMLTLFGFVLNVVVAGLLVTGHLVAGGVMLIVAGLFDMLDGALAKITNQDSTFSTSTIWCVDRYSEATVLLGLLLYFYLQKPRVS